MARMRSSLDCLDDCLEVLVRDESGESASGGHDVESGGGDPLRVGGAVLGGSLQQGVDHTDVSDQRDTAFLRTYTKTVAQREWV